MVKKTIFIIFENLKNPLSNYFAKNKLLSQFLRSCFDFKNILKIDLKLMKNNYTDAFLRKIYASHSVYWFLLSNLKSNK